jgi:hypothetical protein
MVTDASQDLISSDTICTVANIHGVKEGTFSVVPLFLDHFIIHYRSQETCDRNLGASAVSATSTFLVLHP